MFPISSDLPHVLLVLPHPLPSATIYIVKPLQELARQGKLVFSQTIELEVTAQRLRSSDVVLFSRNMEPASDWILEECLANRIPTVYDLDDNFWEVPPDLIYAPTFRAPERLSQLERYLTHAGRVRVYSQVLAERVSPYNRDVIVAAPCLDFSLVPPQYPPRKDDILRITYATGRGGGDSLIDLFADDLRKLLDARPGKVEMYWWGEIPPQFAEHPASRLVGIIHDYDAYLRYLSTAGFDIGLAPLTPTSFNLSKTNTKFRDYAAAWLAGIYSKVEVYADVAHEYTGWLVDDRPGAWLDALTRLADDERLLHYIQTSAHQFVYNHYRQELAEEAWLELVYSLVKSHGKVYPVPAAVPLRKAIRPVKLALGCQYPPPAGFIGVDDRPYPGVSVIADLSQPLPFATDCADQLLADSAFERLDAPQAALGEIYRVSRHAAGVCILAQYSQLDQDSLQGESARYAFNEHTPRSWTGQPVPAYRNPYLAEDPSSEIAHLPVDIRCTEIEFFYFPEYLSQSEHNRRKLRQELPRVCDQLLYRCVVVKRPVSLQEIDQLAEGSGGFEPERIRIERLRDGFQSVRAELDDVRRQYEDHLAASRSEAERQAAVQATLNAALEATKAESQAKLDQLRADSHAELQRVMAENQAEVDQLQAQNRAEVEQLNAQNQAEIERLKTQSRAEVGQVKAQSQAEIEQVRADARTQVEQVQAQLDVLSHQFGLQMYRARHAVGELDVHRNRRVFRLIERFFDRSDFSRGLPPAFSQLLDDSLLYHSDLRGYRLQASPNLQNSAYLSYPIQIGQPGLCEVSFALLLDLLPSTGYLGIDIIAPSGGVLAHATTTVQHMEPDRPIRFSFEPLPAALQGAHELRIFCRELDVPVRLFEWRKYPALGLGPVRTRAFCSFGFAPGMGSPA